VFLGTGGDAPVEPSREQVAHLYRLGDPALAELELEDLLEELLVRVSEILDVDTVAILLLDEPGETLVARAARGIEEEVHEGVRIPVGAGFAGRIAAERTPIFIADVDHADILNPILRRKRIRSLLGVPMVVEGNLVGVLHVGTLEKRVFTNEHAAVLQLAAARAAPAIERARLFDALEKEHRSAVALQRSLLPERLPDVLGAGVAARYLPSRDDVGGDWYDVVELPRGRVGVAIGDVAGHGARAAALMGQLRTALRVYALEGHGPAELLERLDRLLQSMRGHKMTTAAYMVFDPETSALRLASAGHPPPLVVPESGTPRFLEHKPAPPIGTVQYATYEETETTLEGGDIALLYTDGLIEVRGESLTDGLERLRAAAEGASSPERLCQELVRTLVPRDGAADDVALVALQSAPIPERLRLRFPADPVVLAQMRHMLRRWLHDAGAGSDDIGTITLACGEACANAIEHAYSPVPSSFELEASRDDRLVTLSVRDAGRWRAPRGENRGRGLTIIEAAMDEVDIRPASNGTEVLMRRRLRDES
jgi:serine phosphatase RsbU (regulator of sigma subunit)/anti-sigma regulatory factor (Ser/Thr protein kinase)